MQRKVPIYQGTVKTVFSESASLVYSFIGFNLLSGSQFVKKYSYHDYVGARVIRDRPPLRITSAYGLLEQHNGCIFGTYMYKEAYNNIGSEQLL